MMLHVPDMAGRYNSNEFVNPSDGSVFAHVGRRTTGTRARNFVTSGPTSDSGSSCRGRTRSPKHDEPVVIVAIGSGSRR